MKVLVTFMTSKNIMKNLENLKVWEMNIHPLEKPLHKIYEKNLFIPFLHCYALYKYKFCIWCIS